MGAIESLRPSQEPDSVRYTEPGLRTIASMTESFLMSNDLLMSKLPRRRPGT